MANNSTIIDQDTSRGQYDLPCTVAIIEHPKHGRLLLAQGFGGMNSIEGGMYRWRHGLAIRLLPEDTLDSLAATSWNDSCTLYDAVLAGRDDDRPLFEWDGHMIAACAAAAGL